MGGAVERLRTTALLTVFVLSGCTGGFVDLWLTADQQGRLAWQKGEYDRAADTFEDPMWRGTALYMTGAFGAAIEEFGKVETADAWFAQGNARAHLKEYGEAIAAYEKALELDEDHQAASENLEYVRLFIPYSPEGGGDMGAIGDVARPDEIQFDAAADKLVEEGKETTLEGTMLTDEQIAELWLQQVDTSPAAFLRYKFSYQLQGGGGE